MSNKFSTRLTPEVLRLLKHMKKQFKGAYSQEQIVNIAIYRLADETRGLKSDDIIEVAL